MTDTSLQALMRRHLLLAGAGLAAWPAGAQTGANSAPAAAAAATATPLAKTRPPIFVLNSLDATISVIDPVSWKELQRIPTGKEPHHLYLTPDDKSVIVANAGSNSVTFIDPTTAQVQRTVRDIADPYHLRFSPDMKWFVTASNRLHRIDIYRWQPAAAEPFVLAKRIEAPKTPSHIFIDSKSTVAFVTLQDSNELIAIDLNSHAVRWKIGVGKMPADCFLTRDDKHLLVALTGDKVVEIYDVTGPAPKLVKRLETAAGAHSFRSRGDGRHVFLSNRVANTISLIDLQTFAVVAEYPGPSGPDDMDVTADGKTLLLASRWAGMLTVIDIDSRKMLRQVKVGRSPHGVWTLDHAPRV